MYKLDDLQAKKLESAENNLLVLNRNLESRCDELQKQINQIRQEQSQREADIFQKSKESLFGPEAFATDSNGFKSESQFSSYSANIESQEWQEPRMFTLKQVRNAVYSILNQSVFNEELNDVIKKAQSLHDYTQALNETDKQLNHKFTEELREVNDRHKNTKQEQADVYTKNQKQFAVLGNDISNCQETIKRQKDELDNLAKDLNALGENAKQLKFRVDKVKENLQDEMLRQKEESEQKFIEVENFTTSELDRIKQDIETHQINNDTSIVQVKEEYASRLDKEI